jgi:hypothetical protein
MAPDYRSRAKDAEALARTARSEAERQAFEEIADIWSRLAEREADRPPRGAEPGR